MDAFLSLPTSHCHAPQPDCVPAIKLKNEIKARAATTDESTSTIIHSALCTYPLSAAGQLPKNESLMLMIRRQRTTETVDANGRLPKKLRKTYHDEDFIMHDDKKLIIFTTKTNLSTLKQNKHWFADGTFKVCPDDYYQLFTLHAMMTNAIIPLVYGLLIGKSADDYNLFFEKVLKQDNFQPESIMTDFEAGTIKSVKDMLPIFYTKVRCLFRFSQAAWRQVQSKGLTTKYKEDEVFRLNVKQLIALAFVPLDQIIIGFDLICDLFDDDADDLLEYFEKTRIGTGRKKPQFDHKLWNIHDRVVATVPRSNNSVEGWHNAFASRVAISHPTIVKLGEKIRRKQSKFEVDIAKILQGHNIKTKKACYRKLDERITRLANSFDPTQLDQFLKSMAANITL
ncbi:unnamed protein product [Rotaria magnacalcarata]|uniref:MULE transposase domain-containing protein n=1 Tax=Rotaria magnacalcarata TaxID=392030 RepID=A0A814H6B7_9BILA|nr:unnamed protein product [Rotaria magnacalcarata]CAF4574121.1 unnamed protein product [Rotaria magnacalcarata]